MDYYDKPLPQTCLFLAHHGILGQKWGKRNGPPYPLGASDHSVSEKKAGWRKSLDKQHPQKYHSNSSSKKEVSSEKKGLTDKQKHALKIGITVAATALVAYGGYKLYSSGKLNPLIEKGRTEVDKLLADKHIANMKASGFKEQMSSKSTDFSWFQEMPSQTASVARNGGDKPAEFVHGFKKLSKAESLADTLQKTNPNRGNALYDNNCVLCSIAGFMRQSGYDVTAGSTGGSKLNLAGMVEKCFRGAKIIEGSAVKFGRSQNDAAEVLLKRFGPNAQGVCGVQWKGGSGGHAFSWKIVDGVVSFFDTQSGSDDVSHYWRGIDSSGNLTLARLDGLEIDFDTVNEFLEKN